MSYTLPLKKLVFHAPSIMYPIGLPEVVLFDSSTPTTSLGAKKFGFSFPPLMI